MSFVTVTSDRFDSLILRAQLSRELGWRVGEIFTVKNDDNDALAGVFRNVFGDMSFRWFCVDPTREDVQYLTFSNAANPRLLMYRNMPVQIATKDAESFSLTLKQVDCIKPSMPKKSLIPAALIDRA